MAAPHAADAINKDRAVRAEHTENVEKESAEHFPDVAYDDEDTAPQLHWRTYLALASMCLLQYTSMIALIGPPTAVGSSS
jgi:hypothetical protein